MNVVASGAGVAEKPLPAHRFAAAIIAARLGQGARLVAAAMFAAVFLLFCYKIVERYLVHHPIAWGDEVCVILFIWINFWANAFIVRDHEQICFDLAYRPAPPPLRRVMALLRAAILFAIFAWSLPGSISYILFLWRQKTPVLSLRLDFIYSCFGIFLVAVLVRTLWNLAGLLGPRWRDRV
jgi:TRAP-type C4-dicarboxylate transport system permease small subunit